MIQKSASATGSQFGVNTLRVLSFAKRNLKWSKVDLKSVETMYEQGCFHFSRHGY
jgi:hypothetical protein